MRGLFIFMLAAIMLFVLSALWLVAGYTAVAAAFLIAGGLTLTVGYFSTKHEDT